MTLKTDYKDYQFQEGETLRKYQEISNNDGTISFRDVTSYQQEGDRFSASDINSTNAKVNELEQTVGGIETNVADLQSDLSLIQGILRNESPDNFFENGKVTIYNTSQAGLTNAPTLGGYFSYITFGYGNYGVQLAINRSVIPQIFARRNNGGTWLGWVQYGAMSFDSGTNTLNISL